MSVWMLCGFCREATWQRGKYAGSDNSRTEPQPKTNRHRKESPLNATGRNRQNLRRLILSSLAVPAYTPRFLWNWRPQSLFFVSVTMDMNPYRVFLLLKKHFELNTRRLLLIPRNSSRTK
ncbi:hypothetical protein L596_002677 [Steinernema carpocapsae]|uniref:Uncharacterized protein n=1 Tax=Steinernema carpocapsae TaxID=34508 RepID=A0A4U8URS8_STECR|nr:hypothetical protein L596_002677 [Steinernema carpocapsae]